MSETSIAWTDYTFNPWWGCVRVSPGCENCYAETFAHRLGLDLWGPGTERRFFGEHHWNEPRRWERRHEKGDPRHRVLCASMADVFEGRANSYGEALDNERAKLWRLIEATPNLTWQLLTKRPENVLDMVPASWRSGFPANVWMLVTAEDQERADLRIPVLLQLPARVRGVSYEPALGPVDFTGWLYSCDGDCSQPSHDIAPTIDWVIAGGESGAGARPFDVDWARSTVKQCKAAGVAVFVKQLGAKVRVTGDVEDALGTALKGKRFERMRDCDGDWRVKLNDAKGGDPAEWPADLRVREFPA